jgi:tetratricopeptide (TPR) repeat protein
MWYLFSIWISLGSIAHGDLDQRIHDLTINIGQFPDSIQLYMNRGELYLLHEEYDAARTDFEFCLEKQLTNARIYLGYSKSLWWSGQPDSTVLFVDRALTLDLLNPSALEWKGFVLQQSAQCCASAETFELLISISQHPVPSLFMDASAAWMNCDQPTAEENAIEILLQGFRVSDDSMCLKKN